MAKVEPSRTEPQRPTPPGQQQPAKKQPPRAAGEISWHPVWRWLVSLLIVLHLTAVFSAPWDMATSAALPPGYIAPTDNMGRPLPPQAGILQEPILTRALHRTFFNDYLNLLYLNHGYEFFAPDPNGSNLIRYQIRDSGGREITSGQIPDLSKQWPRLLYHRHMMLAAQTGDMGEESGRRYAQHLLNVNGGHTITTELVFHKLLSPQDVKNGAKSDAAESYQVLAKIQEVAKPKPEQPIALPSTEGAP